MNRLPLLIAVAISSIAPGTALAQVRLDDQQAPGVEKHFGLHQRHWDHRYPGHRHPRPFPAPRHWVAPVRPYSYYDPYRIYPHARTYSYYEPAPVYVERVYEPPAYYVIEPPRYEAPRYEAPPAVEAREVPRAYAQAPEPPPRPRVEAQRLERYTLSAKELFGFDEATVRGAQPKLDEIAEAMRQNPQINDVTITGHTDRIGSDAYNLKLSQRRADAVKAYLVGRGVAAQRLAAIGKGKAAPVVQCSNANRAELIRCLEPNRRVEVEQITIERRVR